MDLIELIAEVSNLTNFKKATLFFFFVLKHIFFYPTLLVLIPFSSQFICFLILKEASFILELDVTEHPF